MGIIFDDFRGVTSTPSNSKTNILNLQKNDILDLTKKNPGVKKVNLGAGWDVAQTGNTDFDLDIGAYLLNTNGKITGAQDVVYFNNKSIGDFILLNHDDRTGGSSENGDDEVISLDLSKVPTTVSRIVFTITIYDAINRQQSFGMVNNSYVRLIDVEHGEKELCRYQLKEDFSTETAVIVAELVRDGSEWQFHAIGEGKRADFNGIAGLYM